MDEYEIDLYSMIHYHPLCDLKQDNILDPTKEKVINRKNIKFLTFNIFLRPPPVKNNDNDWKDERMEDFCKEIHNFDIICLQEMFGSFNSRKQYLIRHATKSGFFFYVDTSSPSFLSKYLIDGGLVILSRFPIISYVYIPFKYGVIADSLAQKGLLYAKVLVRDSYLHIFTTHLQASYMDSGEYHFRISCDTRMEQIRQINSNMSNILAQEYSPKDFILLSGDFNVDALKYQFKKPCGLRDNQNIELEYDNLLNELNQNNLKSIDIFKFYKDCHPITYGEKDHENGICEKILTHIDDHGCSQSLDYIFECRLNNLIVNKKKFIIDPETLKVEKFTQYHSNSSKLYTQLSDHYGLSCEIKYIDDSEIMNISNISYDEKLSEDQLKLLEKFEI